MDFDEPQRQVKSGAAALPKEALDDLSVYELKARIEILESEIARTQNAIAAKESGQSDAEKLFK